MTKPRELLWVGIVIACGFVACGRKPPPLPVSLNELILAHHNDPSSFKGACVLVPLHLTEFNPVARSACRRLRPNCLPIYVIYMATDVEMPAKGYYEVVGYVDEPDRKEGDRGLPELSVTIILRDCRVRRLD